MKDLGKGRCRYSEVIFSKCLSDSFTVHGEPENMVLNLFTCTILFAKLVIFRESDLKNASLIILSD